MFKHQKAFLTGNWAIWQYLCHIIHKINLVRRGFLSRSWSILINHYNQRNLRSLSQKKGTLIIMIIMSLR